ncbi:UvrD-helicase domain-containing protein [Halalkalirubrum salinum]|uniref:UvrD-helicase domain-containing protein n=1 Tax=Halalkalirubrum salinum TaxID=2563889 RepID=UPI0010FAF182|nr:UvrD-helicase domain-containing protein [Halalkalirubrum salinum]
MEHSDLLRYLSLELPENFEFTSDQGDVMYAYHEGTGRVCVGSGAGTGKTTTLTRVVSEAVVRMVKPEPENINSNPFDEILVTTFTRDAAGQLKGKIKSILRDHQAHSNTEFDPALWRWIETESHISTIDSFVGDLLREIATEVKVSPGFEIRDDLETQELLQTVIRDLRDDPEYEDSIEFLERELDGNEDPSTRQFIYEIHQKLREFCYEFPDPNESKSSTLFSDQIRDQLHQGFEPPFDATDIRAIAAGVTGEPPRSHAVPSDTTIENIEADYRHSLTFAEAVETVLDGFNEIYDRTTRATGALSYQDVTYIVWSYLTSAEGSELVQSLQQRFSHLFIDEFQDTSFAQCQILQKLITNDNEPTQVLVIGDIKQSIYSWRSADPAIFAHILDHAGGDQANPDEYLGVTNWERTELVTNFRSHPHLIRAGNHLFNRIFSDAGRGAIGTFPIEHGPLIPMREETALDEPHLHVVPLGDCNADGWRKRDPQKTAASIRGMVDDETATVGDGDDERPVQAGDVTILFRRGKRIGEFREALDEYGLSSAVVAERGLFKTEEVRFVINVLDWFANPHSKDSLLRILRSPVTALSDRTLRYLASKNLNIGWALDDWPDARLPNSDKTRLDNLVSLRSDLRWDREGPKAELVQKIIQHTAIEAILLAGDSAMQRYGNLWMLVEVTRDWEEDEIIPYREFVDRLHRYEEMAQGGNGSFELAQTADASDTATVKLRTVHSSKGLEFDVVVLADLPATPGIPPEFMNRVEYRDPDSREPIVALRPRPAGEPTRYDSGPGSMWIRTDDSSTLWITDARENTTGNAKWEHPYNPAWREQVAEFWRLLYVAFTRASDHIVFSLPDSIHHFYRWKSWATVLNEVFQPGDQWPTWDDGTKSFEFAIDPSAQHANDEGRHDVIPFGVGSLSEGQKFTPDPLKIPDVTTGDRPTVDHSYQPIIPSFTPRELKPSSLYDLSACPRRFQYRALQGISEARGESPPGTNAPSNISASQWGSLVHNAFEKFHKDVRDGAVGTNSSRLQEYLEELKEGTLEIQELAEEYQETETWNEIIQADTILPEYELSAMHPSEPRIHLSGFVDLLYSIDGKWVIIDLKTGDVPSEDSYLADQYETQLATYAWLLNAEYDIEVTTSRLIYVQTGQEHEHKINWEKFEEYLSALPGTLTIESGEGLPTDPQPNPSTNQVESISLESRCGSCPYTDICPAWSE